MLQTRTITSVTTMQNFSNSPGESDADLKMGKRMRSHYRKLAWELYGVHGMKAVSACETEHEVSRVLHDLRTAAF